MAESKLQEFKKVLITVNDYAITVEPDYLRMGQGKEQLIQWEIVTDGWVFPRFEDGIEVKGDHGEFSNGRVNETGTIYVLHNKNSHTHYFPYTIKVTNGKITLVKDPGIGNEGNQ